MARAGASTTAGVGRDALSVGIVCDELSFTEHGGSNYSIHCLATELTARGHSVDVITLNLLHENDPPDDREYAVKPIDIDHDGQVDAVKKVYHRIGDLAAGHDVLHIYYPRFQSIFGLWKRRHPADETAMVGHLNSYAFCSNTSRMRDGCWESCNTLKRLRHSDSTGAALLGNIPTYAFDDMVGVRALNYLDGFCALSPAVKRIYAGAGVDESLIDVVPNMADPEFPAAGRRQPALADGGDGANECRILFAGRTDDTKGVDLLLEAAAQLECDGWHLDIVGDDILDYGYGLDDVRTDIDRLGLGDRVTTHGWVDYRELAPYYAQADVFVHPGRWPEPFGRTMLEALQHDCALITSDIGAPPWVAGDAGLAVPPDDAGALADRLETLVRDGNLRARLQRACERELQRFDADHVVAQYEAAYRRGAR